MNLYNSSIQHSHPVTLSVGKLSSRNTKRKAGNPPFWGNLGAILSKHNLLCQKFAAFCQKITTSCPHHCLQRLLTHDAAGHTSSWYTIQSQQSFLTSSRRCISEVNNDKCTISQRELSSMY